MNLRGLDDISAVSSIQVRLCKPRYSKQR